MSELLKLRFKFEYFRRIRSGEKSTTIRPSARNLTGKDVLLVCGSKSMRAVVTTCTIKRFADLNSDDAAADGFTTLDELQKALLDIYPWMKQETLLTVIEFQTR